MIGVKASTETSANLRVLDLGQVNCDFKLDEKLASLLESRNIHLVRSDQHRNTVNFALVEETFFDLKNKNFVQI